MEQVYIYIRVSTKTQADKGYGLVTQQRAIKDYCKQHNYKIAGTFIDKGISGTSLDREGLTDLLAAFNGIRKVIVLNTSRLWRDDAAKVLIQRALKQAEADVVSVEQPTYSIYTNDPNDFLINSMMELLDQYERLSINMKLAKGRKTKARSGSKACGTAPLGYRWTNTAEIEIDPNAVEVVKLVFKMYLQLSSVGKLKNYLDDNGYVSNRRKSFSKQALADILSNDFYIGAISHGTIKAKGLHEPIITKTVFNRVQKTLSANRKR